MHDRTFLLSLAAAHALDAPALERLRALAGLNHEPPALAQQLRRGLALCAGVLGALGLIFWIAANWDLLGRFGRFALLQAAFLVCCTGCLLRGPARPAFGVLALAAIGGQLAYFGQTYQTGADPWQLFALWAVLALPLCWHVRSDWLWLPWSGLSALAIQLWLAAHGSSPFGGAASLLGLDLAAWGLHGALALWLSPLLSAHTGAGRWAWRSASSFAILVVCLSGAVAAWQPHTEARFVLAAAVLMLGLAAARGRDLFIVCACLFALDVLAMSLASRLLLNQAHGEVIGAMFLLTSLGAGLLSLSVSWVMKQVRAAEGA
ncbi:DUF2157 domain-containing protein [Massilia sp. TS11]|uniref:DUF2157 domain-containing protein n=1 Tax=Massilia sp. TS11 TaxID=2908003 RepID=UPI001EDB2DB1|nr:DUF2157 domain-containing protein [Massilia sp. TS11]MCG2586881.1 DUF2157 domain-containing protein [Massilia sp. TS11]